ncbi:MAG: hypothetical protein J6T27_01425 [Alphaproteobacteria bacterium]|nr:hypothetical protein [Alphaproteobacteria bacterium]
MKGGVFGALSLIAVLTAVPALATDPAPAAFKTVASQAYVDITRQSTISATSDGTNNTPNYVYNQSTNPNAGGSVVTTTTTAGTVGERGIANAAVSDGNGGYSNGDWLPTVNAMMGAINAHTPTALTWTSTETTAAGNYSTTFDGTTGNWPAADAGKLIDATGLATALSNKQNKIAAGNSGDVVTYSGTAGTVGSVAVYNTANAYNASTDANKLATAGFVATKQNQIGATTSTYVYDSTNNTTADGSVVTTNTLGVTGERGIATAPVYTTNNNVTTLTNSSWLPTMGAMMNQINTATATLTWTSTETTAAGNYSTTFDGQTGNWPAADADKKVDGTALAAALATKQNKMVCTGWSSDTHTDANCWIWSIE